MFCRNCDFPIRETSCPVNPFVHIDTGNAFCDVLTTSDAIAHTHDTIRMEAQP